jgi:hypothetical protein
VATALPFGAYPTRSAAGAHEAPPGQQFSIRQRFHFAGQIRVACACPVEIVKALQRTQASASSNTARICRQRSGVMGSRPVQLAVEPDASRVPVSFDCRCGDSQHLGCVLNRQAGKKHNSTICLCCGSILAKSWSALSRATMSRSSLGGRSSTESIANFTTASPRLPTLRVRAYSTSFWRIKRAAIPKKCARSSHLGWHYPSAEQTPRGPERCFAECARAAPGARSDAPGVAFRRTPAASAPAPQYPEQILNYNGLLTDLEYDRNLYRCDIRQNTKLRITKTSFPWPLVPSESMAETVAASAQ